MNLVKLKSAEDWANEMADTRLDGNIRAIQANALRYAAYLCHLTSHLSDLRNEDRLLQEAERLEDNT